MAPYLIALPTVRYNGTYLDRTRQYHGNRSSSYLLNLTSPTYLSFTTFAGPEYQEPKMASHDLRAGPADQSYPCSVIT
jgi:hypothetical protein